MGYYQNYIYLFSFITLHGLPAAITPAGIDFVTTLPAPITVLSPIVTFGHIIAPPPIHTLFPIFTFSVKVCQNFFRFHQYSICLHFLLGG